MQNQNQNKDYKTLVHKSIDTFLQIANVHSACAKMQCAFMFNVHEWPILYGVQCTEFLCVGLQGAEALS